MLSLSGQALTVPFGAVLYDTAAGGWRKRCEYYDGRGASTLQVGCRGIDSLLVCYREEHGYQQMLAAVLADVRYRSTVLVVMAPNLCYWMEDLRHLYFIATCS